MVYRNMSTNRRDINKSLPILDTPQKKEILCWLVDIPINIQKTKGFFGIHLRLT